MIVVEVQVDLVRTLNQDTMEMRAQTTKIAAPITADQGPVQAIPRMKRMTTQVVPVVVVVR